MDKYITSEIQEWFTQTTLENYKKFFKQYIANYCVAPTIINKGETSIKTKNKIIKIKKTLKYKDANNFAYNTGTPYMSKIQASRSGSTYYPPPISQEGYINKFLSLFVKYLKLCLKTDKKENYVILYYIIYMLRNRRTYIRSSNISSSISSNNFQENENLKIVEEIEELILVYKFLEYLETKTNIKILNEYIYLPSQELITIISKLLYCDYKIEYDIKEIYGHNIITN